MLRTRISLPLLMLCLSGAAHAELPFDPKPERSLVAQEMTRGPQPLSAQPISEPRRWQRIHLAKGAGFEVRRDLAVGERDVVVGVKGPLMKRKRLGLSFEVRF